MNELFKDTENKAIFRMLKDTTDVFVSDEALNVHNTDYVLTLDCPEAHCVYGAEYVMSLFFSDICKLVPI